MSQERTLKSPNRSIGAARKLALLDCELSAEIGTLSGLRISVLVA
jgi:hypothetical protein